VIDRSGIFHVLATPSTDDGALDVDGLPRLVETALATGVSGITVHLVAGYVPVVAGAGRRSPG
jgi:4-hydroxy-tetrahydrodipicolinate synthase